MFVCCSCTIDWQKGKNVTVKVIKKVQKHKEHGTKRTVTKTVPNDSFFNFFSPPDVPGGEEVVSGGEIKRSSLKGLGVFLP